MLVYIEDDESDWGSKEVCFARVRFMGYDGCIAQLCLKVTYEVFLLYHVDFDALVKTYYVVISYGYNLCHMMFIF